MLDSRPVVAVLASQVRLEEKQIFRALEARGCPHVHVDDRRLVACAGYVAQIAGSLQGVVTQALLPTSDGKGRVPALEILLPDDAVRNLIRQGKVEQIYSVMQTNSGRGMQTMEQSLADLIIRRVVDFELGLSRSSRPAQLIGLLERTGFEVKLPAELDDHPAGAAPLGAGLRVAGT